MLMPLLLLLLILLVVFPPGVVHKKFAAPGSERALKAMPCFALLDRGNGGGILYTVMETRLPRTNSCFFFTFNFNILCFYFELWLALEPADASNRYSEDQRMVGPYFSRKTKKVKFRVGEGTHSGEGCEEVEVESHSCFLCILLMWAVLLQ